MERTWAGADPAAELIKFADRIWAIQTKDTAPLGTRADDGWTVPLFRQTKADHVVTEHDNPSDCQQFARRSIHHLKALGL